MSPLPSAGQPAPLREPLGRGWLRVVPAAGRPESRTAGSGKGCLELAPPEGVATKPDGRFFGFSVEVMGEME